jgi:hypothetical protein
MSFVYTRDGTPYGFGWMSVNEMRSALSKYLRAFAICETFTELQSAHEMPFRVFFARQHFFCIIRCSDGLYYFDSLGPTHLRTLLGYSPPTSNETIYQKPNTSTCGLFCCLVAAIYSTLLPLGCTTSQLQKQIDYYLTSDVDVNEFNIVLFAATEQIGEEFDTTCSRYPWTQRLMALTMKLHR